MRVGVEPGPGHRLINGERLCLTAVFEPGAEQADLPFDVAMIATRSLVQSQTFVSPSEIRRAVSRMRTLTRRAIRQECRDRGVLVDINAEADRAIVAGLAKFDGHDLLAADADPHAYGRPTADLTGWTPEHGRELTS